MGNVLSFLSNFRVDSNSYYMKLTFITTLMSLALLSCSESKNNEADSSKTSVDSIVQDYVDNNFEKGEVTIESVVVDTISKKKKLEIEAVELVQSVSVLINEGKSLAVKLELKKQEVPNSSDVEMHKSTLAQLQKKFDKNREETRIKLTLAKELQMRSKGANDETVSHIHLRANVKIKNEDGSTSKGVLPFYISTDYKVLKEPKELMNVE